MTIVPAINQNKLHKFLLAFSSFVLPLLTFSQLDSSFIKLKASDKYDRSESFQHKWGTHYRKEWSTPVKIKIANLDTLAGGLTPYESGGGRQSKSLRLRDKDGREYVLRSVDKSFGKALPPIYQGTFIESILNDQVSIGHPYASLTIPTMAEAAGVYHTNPRIYFIPKQPTLDTFNQDFGDQIYMLERRPDENWETAANFGHSKNIIGTEKMLSELIEDNEHKVDQVSFARARLFDMFIGDWGRHEDQWRWASFKNGDEKVYKPVPRDRDQAFTKFDGKWLKAGIALAGLDHLQSFDNTVKDITTYNFTARNLDRRLANELSLKQWIDIAKELQHALTNQVIEQSIKKMPSEVFPISGHEIIGKLKSRRDHLVEYATDYYKFLSKAVDVIGSDKKELFIVNRLNNNETIVQIYRLTIQGNKKGKLIYERRFYSSETNEIRLYGLNDDDVFRLEGTANKGILIRIIGGDGNDIVEDRSSVSGSKKLTQVYDNEGPGMGSSAETRLHISDDSLLNNYNYKSFENDKKGFSINPGFISIGFGYGITRHKWGKQPVGIDHSVKFKYAITRGAFYIDYRATLYQLFGKWNFFVGAGAGIPHVVNFFGVGNESVLFTREARYYRLRSREYSGRFGIHRNIKSHYIEASSFYQSVRIVPDLDRFATAFVSEDRNNVYKLERKHFVGADIVYKFQKTNDPVVPVKGFTFASAASYTYNLSNPDHSFTRLSSDASVYIPVVKFLSFAIRAGGAANIGDAEFYQLNQLGSHENLRGFRKYRFYGKQSFYNNNELRFIFNTKNKVFNGKVGLIGFYDNGRVWQPGEKSDLWHQGYGFGAFIAPFNKVILSGSYGFSKEDRVIVFYFGYYF